MDLHAALLNHSAVMNRYNVGKLDDIRDFQNNIYFKLQFYVRPEDRWYPNYRNPEVPTPITISNAASRLLAEDSIPSDEPTQSTGSSPSSSSVTTVPELPDHPSTPDTEPADSRPTTPTQQLGDGFSVVPGPSRRLQRERPFSVTPDPIWNSTREINPCQHLAAPAPRGNVDYTGSDFSCLARVCLVTYLPTTYCHMSANATSTGTSGTDDSLDNPLPPPVSSPSSAATTTVVDALNTLNIDRVDLLTHFERGTAALPRSQ